MKCIQKIRKKKVVKAKKEREECLSKHSKTRAPCRALGDVESVSFTILALCRNSELYERKLHFGKLSLLFFKMHNTCANQPCSNKCCEDNPCSNGGTCTELCEHAKQKFNCICTNGFFWKLCEKKSPTSCKQLQLQAYKPKMSTTYTLFDPARKSFYQTFCDFTSENGFVWTLLESFTLANRKYFKSRSFLQDYPMNENSFKWNKFRLSLPIMN